MNERDEVLNAETRSIWEENAEGWDDRMADGNRFFRELIWPATKVLLSLREGDRVLDVACGNGVTARAMASLGAHVTAFDFSPSMIEPVREVSTGSTTALPMLLPNRTCLRTKAVMTAATVAWRSSTSLMWVRFSRGCRVF